MRYFEIEFCDELRPSEFICIRGLREPTVEEANEFCASDIRIIRMPVIGVFPITEVEAKQFYDFSNVQNWPVFGEER